MFLAALLSVVVYTLNRNATKASEQQATTGLASAARAAASLLAVDRAELRTRSSQTVASAAFQRAVESGDAPALARIARTRAARVEAGQRTYGAVPAPPRLTSTASLEKDGKIVARATVGLALGDAALAQVRKTTHIPPRVGLLLVGNGRVLVGPSAGARAVMRHGDLRLGSARFVVASVRIPGTSLSVVAAEPHSALTTSTHAYALRTVIAAILTLLIAIGVAIRFARPVAQTFGELSEQAEQDPLTGLANRRLLDARLEEELDRARRHGTHLALVLVDIDDFKQLNDTYGHQFGDDVLQMLAALLAGSIRELDLAGRFGGEEFALVLPGTPVDGACLCADQIRQSLNDVELTGPEGEAVRVTASFGAAEFPACATVDELIELADRSLYEAKRSGKDRVVGAGRRALRHRDLSPAG